MHDGLRERDVPLFRVHEAKVSAGSRAAAIQFVSAGLGAALAVLTGCAALAAASIGALIDALRFRAGGGARMWLFLAGAAASLALVMAWTGRGASPDAAPWMMAFGAIGLLGNAASVLAAFPFRLREFGAACGRVSSWAYLLVLGAGGLALVASIDIPLTYLVGLVAAILAFGVIQDARTAL